MQRLNIQRFAEFAAEAQASGHGASLLQWWCDLAFLVLSMAVRSRGCQAKINSVWLAMLPLESTCSLLTRALNKARIVPLTDVVRAELAEMCNVCAERDPVAATVRVLAETALAVSSGGSIADSGVTTVLLASVEAVAREFETSSPAPPTLPAPGEPERQMEAWIIGPQPAVPRVGEEVEGAFAHCAELAQRRFGSAFMNELLHPGKK